MAQRQSWQKLPESEKPSSAAAVMPTLMAVTRPVPSRSVSRSLARLERIVPSAMIIETAPAYESGAPRSSCMAGQAAPSSESGRPRLMKAR